MTSEWGTPNMIESGLQPDLLLGSKYGHQIHVWDLRRRRHLQALDLGNERTNGPRMRPAHNPTKAYGFVGVVVSLKDLSAFSLALAPRQWSVGFKKGDRDSRGTSRPGKVASDAQRF